MATAAIVLKTSKKLSNDEFSVALRIIHEREPKYYLMSSLVVNQSLKWRCKKDFWRPAKKEDNGLGLFRKSVSNYKDLNSILDEKLKLANQILNNFDQHKIKFDFEKFEQQLYSVFKETVVSNFAQTPNSDSCQIASILLFDYYSIQISVLEDQQRTGLAGLFKENQSVLRKFRPDALLTDVNFRFLETFEYWLRNVRNNKDTSISVKMRNLQRVMNLAIDDNLIQKTDYPFGEKKYSINKRLDHTTKKIAITTDKIGKLKMLDLKPRSSLYFAQQIFLFSYYARGINFIDITFLKWPDIIDSTITYTRRKTRGKFSIPVHSHLANILDYFRANYDIPGNYVFPILNDAIHLTSKQKYTRKKTALKAVNDNLKKLAKLIGEPTLKLTTNVGRHSYATGLKYAGVKTSYITEALGHSTEFQTQTYLADFEHGEIEAFEKKLFNQKNLNSNRLKSKY